MQQNDTQLIQEVDSKIRECKAEIDNLKEKSKNLEIAISVNNSNINNAKHELIKLDPSISDIIDDPVKLQEYADSLRVQLKNWIDSESVESEPETDSPGIIDSVDTLES